QQYRSPQLTHLFLSHLSRNNNCPKLVEELFTANASGVNMVVASRFQESAVYKITSLSKLESNNFDTFVSQPQLSFSFDAS
ncbi:MAG: MBL fold metallo-hydrolase, partial [Bacteroidota bacterium]|nr:MBL fold metallo-hydrolase [Bacteroidota bacterium]